MCSKDLSILKFKAHLVSGRFLKGLSIDQFKCSRVVIVFLIKVRILKGIKLSFQRKYVDVFEFEKVSFKIGFVVPCFASKSA